MSNSSGCGSTLKTILAGLLALVFVVALPLGILARDWAEVIFDSAGISRMLGEHLIDSGVLHQVAVDALLESGLESNGREEGLGSWLQFLEASEFQKISSMIFPPEWAKEQVDHLVKSAYAWIDDDRLLPSLAIDLRPLKTRMLSGGTIDVIDVVIDSWPSCNLDQVEEMTTFQRRTGEVPVLLCEPPEPLRSQLVSSTNEIYNHQIRIAPNRLPLLDVDEADELNRAQVNEQKESIRLLRGLAFASWLLPLALLGAIMSLVIRSFESLSRWWGWLLIASGGMTFLLLLLTPDMAQDNFQRVMDAGGIPTQILEALRSIWDLFLDSVMGMMASQAFLLIILGLLLMGINWWRNRKSQAE